MSKRTFQLLIVEDESVMSEAISSIFTRKFDDINITIVSNRDDAFTILENSESFFDYVTLDLNIPIIKNGFEKNPTNGLAVLAKCVTDIKGIPILILTGTSTVDMIEQFLSSSVQSDIWGSGTQRSTISHLRKERLKDLSNIIDGIKADFDSIFDVEFVYDDNITSMPIEHDHLLRIFSKKHGSTITKIKSIGGGLSKAKVYALELSNEHGHTFIRAISKCGPNAKIIEDSEHYSFYVSRLPPAATPRKIDLLTHGAASFCAVFYSLAQGYDHSFFSASNDGILDIVLFTKIKEILDTWHLSSVNTTRSIQDIRRYILSDDDAYRLMSEYNIERAMDFERKIVGCAVSVQHGDLHGENILIDPHNQSVTLIDYGDISEMAGVIDPLTLECSFLFHPNATKYSWPTDSNLENWHIIDAYTDGSPIAEQIKFCRDWTNTRKRGNREVSACLYAYALRQLKYSQTNKEIAKKLINAAYNLFDAS